MKVQGNGSVRPRIPEKTVENCPGARVLFTGRVRGEAVSRQGLPRRFAPRNDV